MYNSTIEEQKNDVGYYLGQSWHDEIKEFGKQFKIRIDIIEDLNEDWIKNIEQAIELIKQYTPGLCINWKISKKLHQFCGGNKINVTTNIMVHNNLNYVIIVKK